jgi:hypothetical protein
MLLFLRRGLKPLLFCWEHANPLSNMISLSSVQNCLEKLKVVDTSAIKRAPEQISSPVFAR